MEYGQQPERSVPIVSPANMLPVQVIRRQVIAPDVVSVFIVLPGTRQAPAPYLPGQFLTLALPTETDTLYRSYSLCGDGDMSRPWELTIKRMEGGAVSSYFYERVMPGALLYSSLPRGNFTLPPGSGPETPLVMVALGSGITPIMGMLRALNRKPSTEQPIVHLHYASRSPDVEIFGDELNAMDPDQLWLRQWPYYSSEGDRLTPEAVLARSGDIARRAHWYMCGPESLKQNLQERLEHGGVERARIHTEVFATSKGPAYAVESSDGTGVGGRITIEATGAVVDALPQETLLTALERHGYRPPSSCRAGACGTCKLRVLSGQVDPVGEALSDGDRAAGYVLSCIARPIGDVTLQSGGVAPAGAGGGRSGGALVGAGNAGARALVRLGTVVGVSALLVTAWNLTDHQPASWAQASAASAVTTGSTTATPGAAASRTGTPQSPAKATATPASWHGSGATTPPPPTAMPSSAGSAPPPAPAPTATPKPQPTATASCTPHSC